MKTRKVIKNYFNFEIEWFPEWRSMFPCRSRKSLLKELLWFECAVSVRSCFQCLAASLPCSFEGHRAYLEEDGHNFRRLDCLWLTSSSFLPLCKQLPHVPATPDKVTYLAYDNELKFWHHEPKQAFFPYIVFIGYFVTVMRKVSFRKHKKFFEKFSPVLGNQIWGLLHSTLSYILSAYIWDRVFGSPGWLWTFNSLAASPKWWIKGMQNHTQLNKFLSSYPMIIKRYSHICSIQILSLHCLCLCRVGSVCRDIYINLCHISLRQSLSVNLN